MLSAEIDISVSKLLGFETFVKSLKVSVSENLVSEKKSRFRFRKNLVSEKRLGFGFGKFSFGKKVLVSKNLVSEKSLGLGFGKFDLGKKVSVLVSENLASERKNKNNKKEKSTPNKQCKSFI